jgi:hypothetical protein
MTRDITAKVHPMRPIRIDAGTVAIIPMGMIKVNITFPTPLKTSPGVQEKEEIEEYVDPAPVI